jgi:hypothetical protein
MNKEESLIINQEVIWNITRKKEVLLESRKETRKEDQQENKNISKREKNVCNWSSQDQENTYKRII